MFLDGACGDDDELRREVEELLQLDVAVKFVLNIAASADSKEVELFLVPSHH